MKKILGLGAALLCLFVVCSSVQAVSSSSMIGVNVLVKGKISPAVLADLGKIGKVRDIVYQINALTIQVRADQLGLVRARPYVLAANPDAVRQGAPIDGVEASNFSNGMNTWNLDMINVTDIGAGRTIGYNGSGVYVAVLDTGLLDSWRIYFPQERIATEYAACFGGGGADMGAVSSQPNKWEHDQNSHGTHVTSTILGYSLGGTPINGVAPMATVIPVKVLNQNGSGWSSVIARGIVYVADLKIGPLEGAPVVINMSLGGPSLDPMEAAAIDYATSKGVIIVASAGNAGPSGGMGYPGAYAPVISVAAAGWTREWANGNWWYATDVTDLEPPVDGHSTSPDEVYIADFSSRQKAGQDLDVAAPGSWIVGPYQVNSGQISYYYLSGTSMASPHVAGVVALMAQKNPGLSAATAESILEGTALPLPAGCSTTFIQPEVCWGVDATGAGLVDAAAALNALP